MFEVHFVIVCVHIWRNMLLCKDGSGSGLDPKPAGFRPSGGGCGCSFCPVGLRVRVPETGRGGYGFEVSPAGTHRGPESVREESGLKKPIKWWPIYMLTYIYK